MKTGTGVGGAVNTTNALAAALGVPAADSKGNKTVEIDGKAQTVKVSETAPAAADAGTAKAPTKSKKKAEAKKEDVKPAETAKKAAGGKKDAGKETKAKEKKVNPKLEKARKIFDKHPDKDAGEIAGLISKGLEITYSNAYYYVTRVFNKKSKKTTS